MGATGVVVPAHGSVRVTPVVCRASAGAVEHLPVAVVPNLARYLADVKAHDLWAYAADAEGTVAMWDADLTGGVALVLGAEGKGVRPLVRRTCDATVVDPAGREGRLAQRLGRGRGAPVRGAAPAPGCSRWLIRRSTCSTATTFSTRARSRTATSSSTARELRRGSRARGRRRLRRRGRGARDRTARGALHARTPTISSSGWRPRTGQSELVCVVSSDHAVRWTSGQEVRKLASRAFLAESRAGRARRPRADGRRWPRGRPARPGDARAARAPAARRAANVKAPRPPDGDRALS